MGFPSSIQKAGLGRIDFSSKNSRLSRGWKESMNEGQTRNLLLTKTSTGFC